MEPQAQLQTSVQMPTKKIVIVEDNASLADIYKTRLETIGYTIFLAYNGITGLYFIQKELPDLVLLDLMVPDIAGDQILTRMRSSTWGQKIPVFVISNLNETDAPKGLRDLGIEGYAIKANLANDQIDQIVNKILRPETMPAPEPSGVQQPLTESPAIPVEAPPDQPTDQNLIV